MYTHSFARRRSLLAAWTLLLPAALGAQTAPEPGAGWGLADVLGRACTSSPDAQAARHTFRAAYWDYRAYVADFRPSLTLTSAPNLNRAINKVTMGDGSVRFTEQNLLNTDLSLQLSQHVPWTGGTFSVESELQRMDMFSDKTHSWRSIPINVGYSQTLFGFNSQKWSRRIEPAKYDEARRAYLETMELVAARAVDKYFDLATAQSNYRTACSNYAHADTLYRMAEGRHRIGTITENEMLQLEINRLTEEANRLNTRIALDEARQALGSYLGLAEGDSLPVLRLDATLPEMVVDEAEALQWARLHSPDVRYQQRRRLEADRSVAQAKADAGLKADLYVRFGLTQTASRLGDTYRDPLDQQTVSIGLTLPLVDWGKGRGQVRTARSQRDLVETQVAQNLVDFDQNVRRLVQQFNLQGLRVRVAARTDSTALRRSEVSRRLYVMGKSSVLDLNASIDEKDAARRAYLSALHTYWSLYYTLRSLTLYDFRQGCPLQADYEALVKGAPANS